MNRKRLTCDDLDPDYEDVTELEKKKQKFFREDGMYAVDK